MSAQKLTVATVAPWDQCFRGGGQRQYFSGKPKNFSDKPKNFPDDNILKISDNIDNFPTGLNNRGGGGACPPPGHGATV